MKDPSLLSLQTLLPHRPPMILLSGVIGYRDGAFGCQVEIGPTSRFRTHSGQVPSWVGMEYMAQTIAAEAGFRQHCSNQPAKLGLLLGCRRCRMQVGAFVDGQSLEIWSTTEVQDTEVGNYSCSIRDKATGQELMTASLTVFQPLDVDNFVETHYDHGS